MLINVLPPMCRGFIIHDMEHDRSKLEKVNVHVIQIGDFLPYDDSLFDTITKADFVEKQKNIIIDQLDKIYFSDNKTDLVILPELVVPLGMIEQLRKYARGTCYLICGMIYDERYRNKCAIIDPEGNVFHQYKCRIPLAEPSETRRAHRNLENPLHIFLNTKIGDFAAVVCYDFLDVDLLKELRGKIDHLIIVSMNQAAGTFLRNAAGNAYSHYFHIYLCNIATTGKSAICGPFLVNDIIGQLDVGTSRLEYEINMKEYIEATSNPKDYSMKPKRIYKALPAGYVREINWHLLISCDTPGQCVRSLDMLLNKNKDNTIEAFRSIENNVDRDIDELGRCINKTAQDDGSIMRLNYLLENILDKVWYLHFAKIYIKTKGFYTTERFFSDISDHKFEFVGRDLFLGKYDLNLEALKVSLEDVAQCCRRSCIGYGEQTRLCNVLAQKISDKVFLITCRELDKSRMTFSDVTIVAPKWEVGEGRREKLVFEYTNYDDDIDIKPSKETYLNYRVFLEAPRINAILHFHHDNILNLSWKIPIVYPGIHEINRIFRYSGGFVPSIEGRNVHIKDFSDKVVRILAKNVETIIGTRHGAWTFGTTLSNCLGQADAADEEAGHDPGLDYGSIMDYNEKLYKKILDIWRNYENYDARRPELESR